MQNAAAPKSKTSRHFNFEQPATSRPAQAQPPSARRTTDIEPAPSRDPKTLLAVERAVCRARKELFKAEDMYDRAATYIKTRPEFLGARAEQREQILRTELKVELNMLGTRKEAYKEVRNVLESEIKRVATRIMEQAPATPAAEPRTTCRVSFSLAEEYTASQSPAPADPAITQRHTHRRTDPVTGNIQSLTTKHLGVDELSHPFFFLNSSGKVSVHVHTFNSSKATSDSSRPMNLYVDVDAINAPGPKCRPEHALELPQAFDEAD